MAITKILNINQAKEGNPATHLENAIAYIQNPDKTEECVLVGSVNCLPDTAFAQMADTKEAFGKTGREKADCFDFRVDDVSYDMKLHGEVLRKFKIQMCGADLFEDFQGIFDETMRRMERGDSRQEMYRKEAEEERYWGRGRGR